MKHFLLNSLIANFILFLYIHSTLAVKQTPKKDIVESVHQCIHYTNKVNKLLNEQGKQCLSCDPTKPTEFCDPACQHALDYQYVACEGVCLPDGFYFNPDMTWDGCWEDIYIEWVRGVGRCGCSSAFASYAASPVSLVLSVVVALFLVF